MCIRDSRYTWRLHSEKYAQKKGEDHFEILNGRGGLSIFTAFPEKRKTSVSETLIEEMMTPQRPDDLRKISLKTLKIENSKKSKNTYFLNILQPKDALTQAETNSISVKRIEGENCIGVEIIAKETTEIFLFSNVNKIDFGEIQSTAKWISVVSDKNGKELKLNSFY